MRRLRERLLVTPSIHSALSSIAAEEFVSVTITGDCMSPQIRRGDRVQVRARRFYWPGQVLVLRTGQGRYLAHRLWLVFRRKGEWRYITRGDRAGRRDASVTRDAILGRVFQ